MKKSSLINFKDQNGASFSGEFLGEYPQYHLFGTTTQLVNPTKRGYNFEGWYFDSACEEEGPITELDAEDFTSSPTVYAKWSIKEGMTIYVDITVPRRVNVNNLKVLHIHSEKDIEVITNARIVDGEVIFTVTHLSEFAFVSKINNALPGWEIALIVLAGVVVFCVLCYLVIFFKNKCWIREDNTF